MTSTSQCRAKMLCCPSKLPNELNNIKKFAAFNGFPKWIVKNVIRQSLGTKRNNENNGSDQDIEKLYMSLPNI